MLRQRHGAHQDIEILQRHTVQVIGIDPAVFGLPEPRFDHQQVVSGHIPVVEAGTYHVVHVAHDPLVPRRDGEQCLVRSEVPIVVLGQVSHAELRLFLAVTRDLRADLRLFVTVPHRTSRVDVLHEGRLQRKRIRMQQLACAVRYRITILEIDREIPRRTQRGKESRIALPDARFCGSTVFTRHFQRITVIEHPFPVLVQRNRPLRRSAPRTAEQQRQRNQRNICRSVHEFVSLVG